jgi:tetratricopeptide (TPR) repeat protein
MADALLTEAKAASAEENFITAQQKANEALASFKAKKDEKGTAATLQMIAEAYLASFSPEEAYFKATEALKLFKKLSDKSGELAALKTLAGSHLMMKNTDKALETAKDALAAAQGLKKASTECETSLLVAQVYLTDDPAVAATVAKDALTKLKDIGSEKSLEIDALDVIVQANVAQEQYDDALSAIQSSVDRFKKSKDKKEEATVLVKAATVHEMSKEFDNGVRAAQDALTIFRAEGDKKGEAMALCVTAQLRLDKDESDEAVRVAESAIKLYRELGGKSGRDGELSALESVINGYAATDPDKAVQAAKDSMKRFSSMKERKGEAAVMMTLADLYMSSKDMDTALATLEAVPSLFAFAGDKRGEATAKAKSAQIYMATGKAEEALKAASSAVESFKKVGEKTVQASMLQLVADANFMLASKGKGNGLEAMRAAEASLAIFQELEDKAGEAYSLHLKANAELMTQKFVAAQKTAKEAASIFRSLNDAKGEASATTLVAGGYLGAGDFEQARGLAKDARDLFTEIEDGAGANSVDDFLDSLKKYEGGELSPKDFMGFSMKATAGDGQVKAKKKKTDTNTVPAEWEEADEVYEKRFQIMGKATLSYFRGVEGRAAATPKRQEKRDDSGGPQLVMIEKDFALFVVKWVPGGSIDERGAEHAPGGEERNWKKDANKFIPMAAGLGAARGTFPVGKCKNPLLDLLARQKGVAA